MYPTTPKRPCPEIPPSFASPPPSSPLVPFSSPRGPGTPVNTNIWTPTGVKPTIAPFPLKLMELTPDPYLSPDHRVQVASGRSAKKLGNALNTNYQLLLNKENKSKLKFTY